MKYNHFNFKKWDTDSILLTNDFGEWAFVSSNVFQQILGKSLSPQDSAFQLLADTEGTHQSDLMGAFCFG